MRTLLTLILIIFCSVSANAQDPPEDVIEPYDYDTTLKGGYSISFHADDSMQYLYLKNGSKTICELASTSRGMLYKSLGYLGADFSNHFILVHSFGSGNPHYIELVKKSNGKNLLKDGAAWIGASVEKEFVLFSEKSVPIAGDKMTLYNLRTGKKQQFDFPIDIFDGPEILNRIEISELTGSKLAITYETSKGSKTKIFRR